MIADKYKFISRTRLLILMKMRGFNRIVLVREAGISDSVARRLLKSIVFRVRNVTAIKIANSINVPPSKLFASADEINRAKAQLKTAKALGKNPRR